MEEEEEGVRGVQMGPKRGGGGSPEKDGKENINIDERKMRSEWDGREPTWW